MYQIGWLESRLFKQTQPWQNLTMPKHPQGAIGWIASRVEDLTPEQLTQRHAEEMKRRKAARSAASEK
jgi:hypothetical protein